MSAPTQVRPPQSTGALLLNEVREYVGRFCSMPSEAALDVVTLWIGHTHAVDSNGVLVFGTTPRLAILSNGPASGKTRVLEMVQRLSHNGVQVADPTGPAIVSLVDTDHATVCIDEIDMLFGPGDSQRAVRTVLNSGYRAGAVIARSGRVRQCFGPVAMAGMGQNFRSSTALRPTVTRSIIVGMRPSTPASGFRERVHGAQARALCASLEQWFTARAATLATAWPELPEGITDRLADIWEPLLGVAEAAGGDWPDRARAACASLALSVGDDDEAADAATPTQRLVEAVALAFRGADELTTATILERLAAMPGSDYRWPNPKAGAMEVSAMLRPLGVAPVKLWLAEEGRALQGYRWVDIAPHAPEMAEVDEAACDAESADIV